MKTFLGIALLVLTYSAISRASLMCTYYTGVTCKSGYNCQECHEFAPAGGCGNYPAPPCNCGGGYCASGYSCGNCYSGKTETDSEKLKEALPAVPAAVSQAVLQPKTTEYWGVRNSVILSPSTGVPKDCQARLHVCLMHGYTDVTTVTTDTQCHTVCDNTTTNQACTTTDCYSRCDGWWGVTTTCN